jgi:hypothetical protein
MTISPAHEGSQAAPPVIETSKTAPARAGAVCSAGGQAIRTGRFAHIAAPFSVSR